MSRNWIRTCSLVVSGASASQDLGSLRVCFQIKQWSSQSPNQAHFRVYNVSPSTISAFLAKEFTKVEFSAGYQDNVGLIFSGEIFQSISGHENAVDSYVDIFAADSHQGYISATVNKTLSKGYTPQDKWQAAVDAMGQYGITMGLTNVDLSTPSYPRGLPMVGMAHQIMRQVALFKGAMFSIQLGQIHLIDHTKPVPGSTVVMSASTGMIGWPRQTVDGIYVTSLLNPALQPHVNLQIDASSIIAAEQANPNFLGDSGADLNRQLAQQNLGAGIYNIYHLDRQGDTRGQEWYDISTCIGQGGSLSDAALGQGYNVGQN